MPTCVFLTRFTDQGTENTCDSPDLTEHAKAEVESMGGTWKGFFVRMGQYDGLVIAEFPEDERASQAVLTLASSGKVTTETLRAFTLDEFRAIVDDMP